MHRGIADLNVAADITDAFGFQCARASNTRSNWGGEHGSHQIQGGLLELSGQFEQKTGNGLVGSFDDCKICLGMRLTVLVPATAISSSSETTSQPSTPVVHLGPVALMWRGPGR